MMSNNEPTITDGNNLINASPTKDFFIYMLVKDIDLTSAVSDLVDNSIDGAKNLRESSRYDDLFVKISVTAEHFEITDNCGGIDVETAKNYAFRFGRSSGSPLLDYSVGRFGVGMKRAIFKMGTIFRIESITENSKFVLEKDIEEWARQQDETGKEKWDFSFTSLDLNYRLTEGEYPGTKIRVSNLYEGVSDEFSLEDYRTRLRQDLTSDHQLAMQKGMRIYLNDSPLIAPVIQLAKSEKITPAYESLTKDNGDVTIKVYAGLTKPSDPKARLEPSEAGWNVFCNERLVLKADQSSRTGWGKLINRNPSFHNDYSLFRGYTFFESQNPNLLPWNTTKNGIDEDSPTYRSVRQEMAKMMKPVITFLRQLAKERRSKEDDMELSPLEQILFESDSLPLSEITERHKFEVINEGREEEQKEIFKNIQYSKPEAEVNKVQDVLGVKTLKEVGERTFEYFLEMECEEE
mgnify:CR=1 FL=1